MKNKIRLLIVTFLASFVCHTLYAAKEDTTFVAKGNPVITHKYLGDPAALVHNGTVYIYAGHDECRHENIHRTFLHS